MTGAATTGTGDSSQTSPQTADRFRERARSAATLLATAAGALAAGLAFSPAGQSFSLAAQIAGYASLLLMVVGGCFYVAASLHSVQTGTGDRDVLASRIVHNIGKLTRLGSLAGILAVVAALSMAPLNILKPDEKTLFTVTPSNETLFSNACPSIKGSFEGLIQSNTLDNENTLIEVEVNSSICGNSNTNTRTILYIDRRMIDFIMESK